MKRITLVGERSAGSGIFKEIWEELDLEEEVALEKNKNPDYVGVVKRYLPSVDDDYAEEIAKAFRQGDNSTFQDLIQVFEKKGKKVALTIDQEMGKEDMLVMFGEVCNYLDEARSSLKKLERFAKERGFEDIESEAKDIALEFERGKSYPWTYGGKYKPYWESLKKQIDDVGVETDEG